MHKLTVRKIGNSYGVILPKETLEELQASEGDVLVLAHGRDGLALRRHDEQFEMGMAAFDRTRRKFRNALRELAK